MSGARRCAELVLGPGLTLRQADGCAGRARAIVGCVRRSRSLRGPLGHLSQAWYPQTGGRAINRGEE